MKKLQIKNDFNEEEENYSKEYWRKYFGYALYKDVPFSASFLLLPNAKQAIKELMKEKNVRLVECVNVPEIFSGKFERFEHISPVKTNVKKRLHKNTKSLSVAA